MIVCRCGMKGDGLPWTSEGLCPGCLFREHDRTRESRKCWKCGAEVKGFDKRNLFCPGCGRVYARDRSDVLRGAHSPAW
jgi:hypothetical protein